MEQRMNRAGAGQIGSRSGAAARSGAKTEGEGLDDLTALGRQTLADPEQVARCAATEGQSRGAPGPRRRVARQAWPESRPAFCGDVCMFRRIGEEVMNRR